MTTATDAQPRTRTAVRQDAAEILALQKLAYASEAEIYADPSIPPLRQTVAEMEHDIATQVVLALPDEHGHIVGSVRAYREGATAFIGRLIVHPEQQGRGLGKRLMYEIEDRFPEVERFELFTGHRSERNLSLYAKLGYAAFRRVEVSPGLTIVYLEKHRGHVDAPS